MSTRNQARLLSFLFVLILPNPAISQDISSARPSIQEDTHEAGEEVGFFPELMTSDAALMRLELAAFQTLSERAEAGAMGARLLDFDIKAIVDSRYSWTRDSIPVCFVPPAAGLGIDEPELIRLASRIRAVASEWNAVAAVPDFTFGPGDGMQRCAGDGYSVAVGLTVGPSNSQIGRISRQWARDNAASMQLQLSVLRSAPEELFRNLILHEFGHALGMLHEIQHASGQCWSRFDEQRLYRFYREEYGQSDPERVRSILSTFDPSGMATSISTDQLDPTSVMMYAFPSYVYQPPVEPPCWAPVNPRISPLDVVTVQRAYSQRGGGLMALSAFSSDLPEADRRLVDAFIAVLAYEDDVQEELISAIDALPPEASASDIADRVFATAHSARIQSMIAADE